MERLLAWGCLVAAWSGWVSGASAFQSETHRAINQRAADVSKLDEHLKVELGVRGGIRETIDSLRVRDWIGIGGLEEDLFLNNEGGGAYNRSRHHFQNPLLPWPQAGLDGRCFLFLGIRGRASVRWAQLDEDQAGGSARWADARHLFLKSLVLPSKGERDSAAADLFKMLGQQMHLVSDLAVPAHARNDIHCTPGAENFEQWAEREINRRLIETMQPIDPDPGIFNVGVPVQDQIARVPVARLWDTEVYRVTQKPDLTLRGLAGLAEYTNANFFSRNTIFSSAFPFPARTSIELDPVAHIDPKTGKLRRYFTKVRDGQVLNRVAVPGALYDSLPEALKDRNVGLDDSVLAEYATHLFPRAVGYPAALLDYFFRGKFEATIAPDTTEPEVFLLTGKNASKEPLKDGTLRVFGDYATEGRSELGSWTIAGPVAPGEALSDQVLSFRPPADRPVPERYTVVYQGSLGEEKKDNPPGFSGAVIGKAAKYVGILEQLFVNPADGDVYFRNGTLVTKLNVRSQLRPGSLLFLRSWGTRNDTFLVEGAVPVEDVSHFYVFTLNRPRPDQVFRDPPVATLVRGPDLVDPFFMRSQLPPFARPQVLNYRALLDDNLNVILHGDYCLDIPDPYHLEREECHALVVDHTARTIVFDLTPSALGAPGAEVGFTGVFASMVLRFDANNPDASRIVVDGTQNLPADNEGNENDVYRGYLGIVDGNGRVVTTLMGWEPFRSPYYPEAQPQRGGRHLLWVESDDNDPEGSNTRVYLSSLVDGTSTEIGVGVGDVVSVSRASLLSVAPDHLLRAATPTYFVKGWTSDGAVALPPIDTPGFPPEDPDLASMKRLADLPLGVSIPTISLWQVIEDPDLLR